MLAESTVSRVAQMIFLQVLSVQGSGLQPKQQWHYVQLSSFHSLLFLSNTRYLCYLGSH